MSIGGVCGFIIGCGCGFVVGLMAMAAAWDAEVEE